MLYKKICVIGAPAVGKTSLVSRFVRNFFTDRYLSTIGVRVDRRSLVVEGRELCMLIWDLAGSFELGPTGSSYLRGAAGYLLVVDGTRRESVLEALHLQEEARLLLGPTPSVVVINKLDCQDQWSVRDSDLAAFHSGPPLVFASAKSGEGVHDAFRGLAELVLHDHDAAADARR